MPLKKYRWVILLVLAIVSQLFAARAVEALPTQSLNKTDLHAADSIVLPAAPAAPFATAQGKQADQKATNKFAKYGSSTYKNLSSPTSELTELNPPRPARIDCATPLWLLYRSLLL